MPDIFSDNIAVIHANNADFPSIAMLFGLTMDGPSGPKTRVIVDVVTAKKLAILLTNSVRVRERVMGHTVQVDEEFYKRAGIAPEDFL